MSDKSNDLPTITMANTKKEMLEAYKNLLKELKERQKTQVRADKKIEERKKREALEVAEDLSTESVARDIGGLKLEIGKMLTELADRLENEVHKLQMIKRAIKVKEEELQEIYEIGREAETLAALIESQNQKREEFNAETEASKEALEAEIAEARLRWQEEKKARESQIKEQEEAEKKRREREKEEHEYSFKREQQLAKDRFEDEKEKMERELRLTRETAEKELAERERTIAEKEEELTQLRERVSGLTKEMEASMAKAVKETEVRIRLEAKNREDLARKEFEGERNVLTARIESLEKTVKEQSDQAAKQAKQLEEAYQKVQDIAVKAVEGSSSHQTLTSLQKWMAEQAGRKAQDK